MFQLPLYWVDAFTNTPLGGNPCAVILDADTLTSEQMQAIAREINLSETAFVMTSKKADFRARYFTPEGELPFAGHPTIATAHTLIQSGRLESSVLSVTLELPAGIIPVEIVNKKYIMSQLSPKFLRTYDPKEILPLYGLSSTDLLPGVPIQTVSTGTPILMIPLASHEALKKVTNIDFDGYQNLKDKGDFFFPHHFCIKGATSQGTTFARSLGTKTNPLEDPFTGSATGCMAAYLWRYKLIASNQFIAEQGHWLGRPGMAEVEIIGEPDSIKTIKVAGEAVTIIEGKITI